MAFDYNSRRKFEKDALERWEKRHAFALAPVKVSPKQKELFEEVQNFSRMPYDGFQKIREWGKTYAAEYTGTLAELMQKRCGALIALCVPEEYRADYLYLLEQYPGFQYSRAVYRPTVRTADLTAHVMSAFGLLEAYRVLDMYGVTPLQYLTEQMEPEALDHKRNDNYGGTLHMVQFDDVLAARIDAGDTQITEAVKEAFLSDNNTVLVTTALIRGVVKSRSEELHTLLARFLVAARLQEGVRQAVCENADCGRPEAFLTILRAIGDNDLLRFSAVKRAVATWTGICNTEAMDRITQKVFDGICAAVENRETALAMTESEDSVQLVTGLWAIGFYEVRDAVNRMLEIARTGSRNRRLALAYYNGGICHSAYSSAVAMQMLELYPEDFEVAAAFLPTYLPGSDAMVSNAIRGRDGKRVYRADEEEIFVSPIPLSELGLSAEQARRQYAILRGLADAMKKKKQEFSPLIFPWYGAVLEKKTLTEKMAVIAYALQAQDLIDEVSLRLPDISDNYYNNRKNYLRLLLHNPKTPVQKNALLDYVGDKESFTRGAAYMLLKKLPLTGGDFLRLEKLLRFKNEEIRRYVIDLLDRQDAAEKEACVRRLLTDGQELTRLAALDMLKTGAEESPAKREACRALLQDAVPDRSILTDREKILCEEIEGNAKGIQETTGDVLSREGNGLYDPAVTYSARLPKPDMGLLKKYFSLSVREMNGVLDRIRAFLDAHADMEYKSASGDTQRLGNGLYVTSYGYGPIEEKYPFPELWQEVWEDIIKEPKVLFCLYMALTNGLDADSIEDFHAYQKAEHKVFQDADVSYHYADPKYNVRSQTGAYMTILRIISSQQKLELPLPVAEAAMLYAAQLPEDLRWMKKKPPKYAYFNFQKHPVQSFLRTGKYAVIQDRLRAYQDDAEFRETFPVLFETDRIFEAEKNDPTENGSVTKTRNILGMYDYVKAWELGIFPEDMVYRCAFEVQGLRFAVAQLGELFLEKPAYGKLMELRHYLPVDMEKHTVDTGARFYQLCTQAYRKLTDLILDVELRRGDSPTVFSPAVSRIRRVTGIPRLMEILRALGSDPLDRTTYYSWSSAGTGRRECLCHLLKVSRPSGEETAEDLRKAIKAQPVSRDRLIEVSMYAPQWLPLVEAYLGIDGFQSGCYYFMAHMNERFDDRKKAVIARYTPLTPEELNNGCFDTAWFFEVYEKLGEKTFSSLYKAAKYIADGSKHTRARKYADAALGKVSRDELEAAVRDKRNKDVLMSYGLLPLKDREDTLHRYVFLQQFLKESRQFGAQRRQSESLAVQTALRNMATTAGYADATRLTLAMETEMAAAHADYYTGVEIGDCTVRVAVDASGKPSLELRRGGKVLKSVPAALKKDDTFAEIRDFAAELKAQYSRCTALFERAMEEEELYRRDELEALRRGPVAAGILNALVFVTEDGKTAGTLEELAGKMPETPEKSAGEAVGVTGQTQLKVAHPVTLFRMGVLPRYQRLFFTKQLETGLKQPFKQVFREFYLKLEEELDSADSRMFAGYQIQPKKTVAALKGRRWVADYENGLQKVYFKADIAVELYALADWFSPADTECPTLEYVSFSNRRTGRPVKIADVPEVLYSEAMRDTDLAVSVAYAGGVDPETSHSTMEMRRVIIAFNLELFGLDNVTLEGTHALIRGSLGKYTVHLGSGVIHQEGGGMLHILPVHSQQRGKLFLPFIDEDPKTAEILSKILLLAQDTKIKDPYILDQIRRGMA